MKRWKELGEVPDSEAEDFDNSGSDGDHNGTTESHGEGELPALTGGIESRPVHPAPDDGIPEVADEFPQVTGDIWDPPSSKPVTPAPTRRPAESARRASDEDSWISGPDEGPKPAGYLVVEIPSVRSKDLWNPTSSPPASLPNPPRLNAVSERPHDDSSPLSSLSSLEDMDSQEPFPELAVVGRSPRIQTAAPAQQPGVDFSDDEISTSYVTITAPMPGRRQEYNGENGRLEEGAPGHGEVMDGPNQSAGETDPRQAAVRLERSLRPLRPRKPIQEHPYLLENARYKTIMKTHGCKPLRVALEPEAVNRCKGKGDREDQDFTMEESQETRSDARAVVMDDSNPILFDDLVNDRDELALSPSPRTSSPRPTGNTSSQHADHNQTDATSVSGDEEFPSIGQLIRNPNNYRSRPAKRQGSPKTSSKAQRRRRVLHSSQDPLPSSVPRYRNSTVLEPSISHLAPSAFADPSQDLGETPKSRPYLPSSSLGTSRAGASRRAEQMPKSLAQSVETSPTAVRKAPSRSAPACRDDDAPAIYRSPLPAMASLGHPLAITPTIAPATEISSDELATGSDSDSPVSSASESEAVRRHGKRIRGVLPASWLRLDKPKTKQSLPRPRYSPERSPDPQPLRKGVALPRHNISPKPSAAPLRFDLTDEEGQDDPKNFHVSRPKGILSDMPARAFSPSNMHVEDPGSGMEDNSIDGMVARKRRSAESHALPRPNKRRRGLMGQKTTQPKITQAFGRSMSVSSAALPVAERHGPTYKRPKHVRSHVARPRPSTPPRLSILDVLEPAAPRFVKIAARTARRRPGLGKASPSRKSIRLATRADNLDALSSLQDWTSGRIQPRVDVSQLRKSIGSLPKRRPLQEVIENSTPAPSRTPPDSSATRLPDASRGKSAFDTPTTRRDAAPVRPAKPARAIAKSSRKFHWNPGPAPRLAQLEESVETEPSNKPGFTIRKRLLDAVYRRSRTSVRECRIVDLKQLEDDVMSEVAGPHDVQRADLDSAQPSTRPSGRSPMSRSRKRIVPKRVDLQAPQYARAADPIHTHVCILDEAPDRHDRQRLRGLGPYGTHYTQHFDVFPLDDGCHFRHDTLVGKGVLEKINTGEYRKDIQGMRPSVSFLLDQQTLHWGRWDVSTSSELGIVVDWIAEQLFTDGPACVDGQKAPKILESADLVLRYLLESVSFDSYLDETDFVCRSLEVFKSLCDRFESQLLTPSAADSYRRTRVEVLARASITILAVLDLARSLNGSLHLIASIEALLKRLVQVLARELMGIGFSTLQSLYGRLQALSPRSRGIGPDEVVPNGWIVAIRVLDTANIPRASFWDIISQLLVPPVRGSCDDAQVLEMAWSNMFAILPLTEFDNNGKLVSGLRHDAPVQGWAVPQQLLKLVFDAYKSNPRQGPSFNEYCRALVARCHYLVQLWGWTGCSGVIGTVFDFFGSQSLAPLRNEEVYKSAEFLEKLADQPSLSVEPEDRCFHIFLKIVAMTTRHLRKLERTKDIRNLAARITPNHSRQYLKEDVVTQRDLAALRNHHDLLCTLFWTCPPELRPQMHLFEKLIVPGRSHKEACLINMRAWSQLTRFLVSSGEASTSFKPFLQWSNRVFGEILQQYSSAATDMEQQIRSLSREASGISSTMKDEMVRRNKASAMDILHYCAKAYLDVFKMADSLGVMLHVLNINHFQLIFTRFDYASPDFDWSVVHIATKTLQCLVDRLDEASDEQFSSDTHGHADPQQLEEAVLVLSEKLSGDFFALARRVSLMVATRPSRASSKRLACAEDMIKLAAKIASRFVKDRIAAMSAFFSAGKYGLFSEEPRNMVSCQRKYLPLFLALLLKNHVYDFKSIGMTPFGLWMLFLVKPAKDLGYEMQLAEVLKHSGLAFMQRAFIPTGFKPDYTFNRDFFACAMHHMRTSLRGASSIQARQLRNDYEKMLELVMNSMKADLEVLRNEDSAQHKSYIQFVQQIISLVKSHGVGIRQVDSFFITPGPAYSPPVQDPKLQTATVIAYGIRLGEGDQNAVPQLFHYLCNNFTMALANGKLDEECKMLGKAMENGEIATFLLQYMVPAAVKAAVREKKCWLLLDMYVQLLQKRLLEPAVPRQIRGEDMRLVVGVLQTILAGFPALADTNPHALSLPQVNIIRLLFTLVGCFQPSFRAFLFADPPPDVPGLRESLEALEELGEDVAQVLEGLLSRADAPPVLDLGEVSRPLLRALARISTRAPTTDSRVEEFAGTMARDAARDWVVTPEGVTVRVAMGRVAASLSSTSSTQAGSGTRYGPLVLEELLREMRCAVDVEGRRKRARFVEEEEEEMMLF